MGFVRFRPQIAHSSRAEGAGIPSPGDGGRDGGGMPGSASGAASPSDENHQSASFTNTISPRMHNCRARAPARHLPARGAPRGAVRAQTP